jgi:tetratricopeptide (TPR) repeat protein
MGRSLGSRPLWSLYENGLRPFSRSAQRALAALARFAHSRALPAFLAVAAATQFLPAHAATPPKWQGLVPDEAKDPAPWTALLKQLNDEGYHYGALAAAARMLVFFQDLPTKETAYRTIVSLIDQGYPFSADSLFMPGDIVPTEGYDFTNSYNFYKFVLNKERGMQKWAESYFAGIDKENFPKYLFYQALQAYEKTDLVGAEGLLRKILQKYGSQDNPVGFVGKVPVSAPRELRAEEKAQLPFIRKVARTLARVYFEAEEYARALQIYDEFLLRLNPITPSDWLEAAWNLYYLKRYPETLGYLFNLESRTVDPTVTLEKYVLRALAYRALCSVSVAESLVSSFEKDFGDVLKGIKRGEPLHKFPVLFRLDVPGNSLFRAVDTTITELERERAALPKLPPDRLSVATYLYDSELRMQRQRLRQFTDRALERASTQLVMMAEHLRFLKFDVAREKFNPDTVFREIKDEPKALVDDSQEKVYTIRWYQLGDFWRDERINFKGSEPNRCVE